MTQRYRFVGSFTEIGDRVYSRVGQLADWDETFYHQVVKSAAFIPEKDFQTIGFTQDELDRYADYANRPLGPESFNAKMKQCAIVAHDIRGRLSTRQVSEEIASVEMPAAQESGN